MESGEPKRSILLPSKAEVAGGENIRILESEIPGRGERGRTREKKGSSSSGISQNRSRTSSRLRGDMGEYFKWTVLRHDPSERLEIDDREGSEESDNEEDVSDEEQVSDVENELDIDAALGYDLGARVLPNFVTSLWDVLQAEKQWVANYHQELAKNAASIQVEEISGGYARAIEVLHGPKSEKSNLEKGSSYVLYLDLTTESFYALLYVFGAVLNPNDTLYVLHVSPKVSLDKLQSNVSQLKAQSAYLLDASAAILDSINVVVISASHPYPKHLLNEMVLAIEPMTLCVPLSLVLSSLHNYVCPIPTIVIRRKLKRSKKKGINE
ncbi:LANO_0H24784g1_1 [Lachancea nothofagi CBS 11611]|uniref:LANO_0H24784g1_1 n=1 Tax=Lachancea nothofagi CBS 11611 TaxID=1266666 RepID=A0A1G4KP17_9SACH|nr:LANO_0H24784g1_1 [Lachancea nothofagi CBS 11611]